MNAWVLAYDGFEPPGERLREALCTLGNGYFATRGAAPEAAADTVHYPGSYVAGVYNRRSAGASTSTRPPNGYGSACPPPALSRSGSASRARSWSWQVPVLSW